MPPRAIYSFISKYKNTEEWEAAQYTLPNHAKTQSNKVNCGICKKLGLNHGTPHQMNQSYLVCVSKSIESLLKDYPKPLFFGPCQESNSAASSDSVN